MARYPQAAFKISKQIAPQGRSVKTSTGFHLSSTENRVSCPGHSPARLCRKPNGKRTHSESTQARLLI